MVRWSWLAVLALACGEVPSERLVLVTLDTLRIDTLEAMPATAALAATGLDYRSFFATTSSTQPTHASLFTGLHPWEHGVTRNGQILDDGLATIAEVLSAEGWRTAAVVSSFPVHRSFGFAQGFDTYDDEFTRARTVGHQDAWEGQVIDDGNFYSLADEVTDKALAALDEAGDAPLFLWVHYFDPHAPYGDSGTESLTAGQIRAHFGKRSYDATVAQVRQLYEADAAFLDRQLDRLFMRLTTDGVPTQIVVTADHGESLGEEAAFGHGSRLTREQIHVPTFVVSSRVEPGVEPDAAGTVDLHRMLLFLAGLEERPEVPGRAVGMRRSLSDHAAPRVPLADGTTEAIVPWYYAVVDGVLYAGNNEQVRVEDVRDRPADDVVAAPLMKMFGGLDELVAGIAAEELSDPETLEALEALGYVGDG